MVPTDGDFVVKRIARCPITFPTWLPDQEDSLPPRSQDWQLQSAATHIMSQEGESEISEQSARQQGQVTEMEGCRSAITDLCVEGIFS